MEMKSPVQREMSYAEIGLLEEPDGNEEGTPGGWWRYEGVASWWRLSPAGRRLPSPTVLLCSLQRAAQGGRRTQRQHGTFAATTTRPRTATSRVTTTCPPSATRRPPRSAGRIAEDPPHTITPPLPTLTSRHVDGKSRPAAGTPRDGSGQPGVRAGPDSHPAPPGVGPSLSPPPSRSPRGTAVNKAGLAVGAASSGVVRGGESVGGGQR